MAIFRRENSPYYYTEFEIRGHRIKRSTGTTSARDAEAFERKLKEQVKREAPQARAISPALTIDAACGKYWAEHGKKLADAVNVKNWLKYIVRYIDKDMPIRELSTKYVTAFVASLEKAKIGPIAINRTIACFQGVHNRAAKKWEEPVKVINWREQKTKEKPRTRWVTRDRAEALLRALPLHIRYIVLFMLSTGLRRKEAFNLAWSGVNFESATITVRVKGGYDRDVHLSPQALLILQEVPRTGLYVFDTTNWRKHFQKALRVARIDNFRWHDLRHTFATWLGHSGAPLEVIRDQLGHSSIAVTQKYRHVAQGEVQRALHKLPPVGPTTGKVDKGGMA
jgi:integrase